MTSVAPVDLATSTLRAICAEYNVPEREMRTVARNGRGAAKGVVALARGEFLLRCFESEVSAPVAACALLVSVRTVRRWYAAFRKHGLHGGKS